MSCRPVKVRPSTVTEPVFSPAGKDLVSPPQMSWAAFTRMVEMPMVTSRDEVCGALRSRRKPKNSMTTPSAPDARMARTKAQMRLPPTRATTV